jgi:hypothetical protein
VYGPDILCVDDGQPRSPADIVVALAGPAAGDRQRVLAGVELVRADRARILLLPMRTARWVALVREALQNQRPDRKTM